MHDADHILVTGSSGHLGEAVMRVLRAKRIRARGIDLIPGPFTDATGSIANTNFVDYAARDINVILHCATLHKPHIATHRKQDFVDTNETGTLNLLEVAVLRKVRAFIFTSTTSAFGDAINPKGTDPARWITEEVRPVPKNIYGATKIAAENLCRLFFREYKLPCLILRTSRFFPEEDDQAAMRKSYTSENSKANEMLYRRVDLQDAVDAHLLAIEKASELGYDKFIISATTPFTRDHLAALRSDAPAVVRMLYPEYAELYGQRDWQMFPSLDRVYDNAHARKMLNWRPQYNFQYVLKCLAENIDFQSPLSREVDKKGYHDKSFDEGPYPVQ